MKYSADELTDSWMIVAAIVAIQSHTRQTEIFKAIQVANQHTHVRTRTCAGLMTAALTWGQMEEDFPL